MPKYLIEREIPGIGKLPGDELKSIAENLCSMIAGISTPIKWVHSFVTTNKLYCVYSAPNEQTLREYARLSGLPADAISEITSIIGDDVLL